MVKKESQPTAPSEAMKPTKDPPMIVTKQGSPSDEKDDKSDLRQARTPKHANTKVVDEANQEAPAAASRQYYPAHDYPPHPRPPHPAQQQYGAAGYQYPPHQEYRYDQRQGPPFSPGQQQQQQPYYPRGREPLPPTISPGNNAYRQGYYGQGARSSNDMVATMQGTGVGTEWITTIHTNTEVGPLIPNYPPQDLRYYSSRSAYPPRDYARGQTPETRVAEGSTPFSRAVSSSLDRSVKSRNGDPDSKVPHIMEPKELLPPIEAKTDGNNSVAHSEDSSWRQLKQVASIDENEMLMRLAAQKAEEKDVTFLSIRNQHPLPPA
jgi:hypothetical protein